MDGFKVSVIIPAYNEEGNIMPLYDGLLPVLKKYQDYEIIFIDDSSTDGTLNVILNIQSSDPHVKHISFSRNFGHQSALKAGLDYATGDCVISMDADMQHPPELIPHMVEKWAKGSEVVYTIRQDGDSTPLIKRLTSGAFYRAMKVLSGLDLKPGAADFRLLDRKAVDAIKTSRETQIFLRGLVSWIGFRQSSIAYEPHKRHSGKSKYSYAKMLVFAMSGITSFSVKPLQLATVLGFAVSVLSASYASYAVAVYFITGKAIPGWASTIVSSMFLGGVQLLVLGIMGGYLGKLFMESKGRPPYIIKSKKL